MWWCCHSSMWHITKLGLCHTHKHTRTKGWLDNWNVRIMNTICIQTRVLLTNLNAYEYHYLCVRVCVGGGWISAFWLCMFWRELNTFGSCSRHTEVASFRLLVAYSMCTKISERNENVSLQSSSWALTPTHPSTPQLNIQLGSLGLILLVNPCHLFSSLVFHCSNWSTGMQCIATQPANLLHL